MAVVQNPKLVLIALHGVAEAGAGINGISVYGLLVFMVL